MNTPAIILGVILAIIIVVMIILLATGNLHFGGGITGDPSNDQVAKALKKGVTISTSVGNAKYTSLIKWKQNSYPGINLGVTSSLSEQGTKVRDIGGDDLNYWFRPKNEGNLGIDQEGVEYTITNTATSGIIKVFPDMTVTVQT